MSVQTQIDRLESAKEAIATAIAGKGVTVPAGTMLDGMSALIESIEAGGGGSSGSNVATGTFRMSSNVSGANKDVITISGLGFTPKEVYVAGAFDDMPQLSSSYIIAINMYATSLTVKSNSFIGRLFNNSPTVGMWGSDAFPITIVEGGFSIKTGNNTTFRVLNQKYLYVAIG